MCSFCPTGYIMYDAVSNYIKDLISVLSLSLSLIHGRGGGVCHGLDRLQDGPPTCIKGRLNRCS